ncbi:arsenic resistance protein [Parapedobacter koreensis]|uniref:Arsenite efflux pump ArsB, ACR3 family n=1 Tax=Parapedobacter koreensis TaxID=332977 RepID=A0A1H7IFF7_9SPHI|nr:arsenic resistance protein [Parapedobacter koreensis]SEK60260.1 Arsenite efflux pump ArsB, ACR3 family [Parapedobacter koreensis]
MNDNPTSFYTTALIVAGILAGSAIGSIAPATGELLGNYVDHVVLTLVGLLFFEVRFEILARARRYLLFLTVAWVANFIIISTLGFLVASLFLSGQPLFFTGLLIYFMAPCTDWMLGFTKLANGNVTLGAILIPVNMVTQLFLYPVYLWLFAAKQVELPVSLLDTVIHWFLMPFAGAVILRMILKILLPAKLFDRSVALAGASTPYVIALLVTLIFSANVGIILDHAGTFAIILLAVFLFFVTTYFIGEGLSNLFGFSRPERVLLAMTTAARNAPLMLGVTVVTLPGQPLIYAAIIIGMLVEFPHLTALTHLLRK